jgi:hypothetical protein
MSDKPFCGAGEHVIADGDYYYEVNPEGGYGQSEFLCCVACLNKPENDGLKQRLISNGVIKGDPDGRREHDH